MQQVHPKRRESGAVVVIEQPSTPTRSETWNDPDSVATAVPACALPDEIAGQRLQPLRFACAESEREAWQAIARQHQTVEEPPFEVRPGMRSAAGVVTIEPDGRIWIVHPTNRFADYSATFPKGSVEEGRSLQTTAIVECFEESGLLVRIVGFLGDFDRSASRTRYYIAERIGGSPADMGWESQAVSLVPRSELPALLTSPHDRPVLAAIDLEVPAA